MGSAKETGETASARIAHALRQVLTRLSWHAESLDRNIMIVLDSVDDKPRIEAVSVMASFIYSNGSNALRRVVEAPMEGREPPLYATIQFADWLCALLGRAAHFQFVENSQFDWAPEKFGSLMKPVCSEDSKILVPDATGKNVNSRQLFSSQNWTQRTLPRPQPAPRPPVPGPGGIVRPLSQTHPEHKKLRDRLTSAPDPA